jgi:hypothetical protein
MKTKTWIDKSAWADGEWQQEPDRMEWVYLGFPCLIVRQNQGWLCGYVGIPPTHLYYGKYINDDELYSLKVHGEITFSEPSHDSDTPAAACHQLLPKTDGYWWLGFDCSHVEDIVPTLLAVYSIHNTASYKNLEFVKNQVEYLAQQLSKLS